MERTHRSAGAENLAIGTAEKVGFLARPNAYPDQVDGVEAIETHMSWVFLTERFAYKLKKPVRYDFLDFRTVEARHRSCREEVRLNRRLAPAVYLDIVALTRDQQGVLQLGGSGVVIDWLVKMRRLPRDRMLDQAIARGDVNPADLRSVALLLAAFYHKAEPVKMSGRAYRARLRHDIEENLRHLSEKRYRLSVDLVDAVCQSQARFLESRAEVFERRAEDHRIIEAHGDLRPEHICLGPEPQIIDCLEFKREFRILDPVDELSFLALECERLGAPHIGPTVFAVYSGETGDVPPEVLVAFYRSFRACLRAKISAWHLREPDVAQPEKWIALAETYLALAENHSRPLS